MYISAKVAQGVDLAFVRLGEPRVIMQVKIDGLRDKKFDKNRLMLMYLDGVVEVDFCDAKSFSELMSRLDPNSAPSFVFEEQDVSAVIWHGVAAEGTGVVGKVLAANSLALRLYFDDYSSEEFEMSPNDLLNLKQKISSEIFGA